jgi:hypothetical protein
MSALPHMRARPAAPALPGARRAETLTIAELCEAVMRAPRAQRKPPLESIATLLHRLAGTSGTLGFARW